MRTVTVTGQGTAREVPDTVVVRVAASHRAAGVAEALAGADSAADEIIAIGREHTEASQIASTNLNLWPAFDNEGKPSGFEARHSLTITCADMHGRRLPCWASCRPRSATVCRSSRSGWRSATPRAPAHRLAPRRTPTPCARAQHLAELAGARLGEVQAMAEGGGVAHPIADLAGGMREAKSMAIAPGETTISGALTVTFELVVNGQAGPTSWATSAADSPTNGSPAPGVACAPTA